MALVDCPSCQRKLTLADEMLGRRIKCPGCQQVLQTAAPSPRPVSHMAEAADDTDEEIDTRAPRTRKKKSKPGKHGDKPRMAMLLLPPLAGAGACFGCALRAAALDGYYHPACLAAGPLVAGWGTFLLMTAVCGWKWLEHAMLRYAR